ERVGVLRFDGQVLGHHGSVFAQVGDDGGRRAHGPPIMLSVIAGSTRNPVCFARQKVAGPRIKSGVTGIVYSSPSASGPSTWALGLVLGSTSDGALRSAAFSPALANLLYLCRMPTSCP